jgi:hypothetical protein
MTTNREGGVISHNPIKEGLDDFRRHFESTRSDLGDALSVKDVFATAAAPGMVQLLLTGFLSNVHRCQPPSNGNHQSSIG